MSKTDRRPRSSRSFRDLAAARARAGRRFRPCSLGFSLEPRCLLTSTVTVSSTQDFVDPKADTSSIANLIANPGPTGKISLREAIIAADNTPGDSEIDIPAGSYNLTIPPPLNPLVGENNPAIGDLDVFGASAGNTLTIKGAGSGTTSITNEFDKVFSFNPFGLAPGKFTENIVLSGLTLTGVNPVETNSLHNNEGGAFDFYGDQLTMNDVTVTNSGTANGDGGGIAIFTGENVTITNCIFSRNTAFSMDTTPAAGGGIFIGSTSGIGRTVAITNTVINNNGTVRSTAIGTPGNGGGLYDGGGPNSSLVLHNVTVANNAAGGISGNLPAPPKTLDGGGVYSATDNLTIDQASSITGNITTDRGGGLFTSATNATITSATIAANGLIATDGSLQPDNVFVDAGSLMIRDSVIAAIQNSNFPGTDIDVNASNNPTVDAANNYLGSNQPDPTLFGASVTWQPFLVANVTASSTDLLPGQSATVTLSITQNSDGLGGFSIPDNTQVLFDPLHGTMNPTQTTTTAGVATSTFTPNSGFVGQAAATAIIAVVAAGGGNSVLFNVGVGQAPVVTTQPVSQVVTAGQSVTLTAAASGFPTPTVQWQISTDHGAHFSNISGATASSYTFTATAATNGEFFQAVFTNSVGSTTSAAALLTVAQASVTGVSLGWGSVENSGPLLTQADGIRLLPAGRKADLPWLNIDRLTITLSALVPLTPADITVNGINVVNYGPVTVGLIGATTYGVSLTRPIAGPDRVTLTISSPMITTYTRRLDVLPGDVNDDGVVNIQDAIIVRNEVYPGLGPVTVPLTFLDINGDGVIDLLDLNLVRQRNGTRLP